MLLVRAWIQEISNDFDHILILEDLDTSLAVMMIKFCWNIDDVAHLKVLIICHYNFERKFKFLQFFAKNLDLFFSIITFIQIIFEII